MSVHLTQSDKTVDRVTGFRVSAVDAGLYAFFGKATRPDLTLIAADGPCAAAGAFTTNKVKAAPVLYDQARLKGNPDRIRAVLVNTASANACTGDEGLRNAERTAAWAAGAVGCAADEVLVLSTGVIGTQLPMDNMQTGIAAAAAALRPDGWQDAARAIMTTDTKPKIATYTTDTGVHLIGIAKGAGMIAPNMATLLSVVVTDADIEPGVLAEVLPFAVANSFNQIVVDGDMSTNDSILVLANGASGVKCAPESYRLSAFEHGLTEICRALARMIVLDAEGATKFIDLEVCGAFSAEEARQVGNAIATSPLVKTAFYGGDANWGRILAAAGRAGVEIDPDRLALWYDDLQLVADGTPLDYDEARANQIAAQSEVHVRLDLGQGDESATIWTCDLSHDYVSINGHYRT